MTWLVFSITLRAADMGFFTFCTIVTDPAFLVLPSIILASISIVPLSVSTDPRPALNNSESSITLTAASTASNALPSFFSMLSPAYNAYSNLALYAASKNYVIDALVIVPAPPCIANANFLLSIP